ncbi:hypothetical protein KY320_00920 [Candidatus Woesearchaeota archaeon]|nr:hypothetical protein [Candidatus Woesearchaeota archaeon]
MPKILNEQLKKAAEKRHYLDTSELVRSLVREHWLAQQSPVLHEIHKLREELREEIRRGLSEKE